jgi:hypothetical protein
MARVAIVRLAWEYQSSRNDAVFAGLLSFVAGPPTDVRVSVKESSDTPPEAHGAMVSLKTGG